MSMGKGNTTLLSCDLCVVGGGLAGTFAALAAARHGARVVLMQDRPVLGGNASSEIRMWVRGARARHDRETGLISELEERNIHYNPTLVSELNDATLYGMVRENENITLLLNTTCLDAETENGKIVSVTGWQLTTYRWYQVQADLFADCSGDSILAPLSGARWRRGRESRAEYGERMAREAADEQTMGLSLLLAARETDHPVTFTPPPFAHIYPTDESFSSGDVQKAHAESRNHRVGTDGCNLWWIELGGDMDSLYDADRVRDDLLASALGVWDHIKNRGDHGMENWELTFVGFLPGKRESRRYIGDYVMTEQDVVSGGNFDDEIAFGGWPLDDHNPHGMRRVDAAEVPSLVVPVPGPYGIPYRTLYSENIENLFFAGRNISVTHVALSSTRVMATCALLGQAVGTAAALCVRYAATPRGIYAHYLTTLQTTLQRDGVFLLHHPYPISETVRAAALNLPAAQKEVLLNGIERPRGDGVDNGVWQRIGDALTLTWQEAQHIGTLRLRFDPDFSRKSIAENEKTKIFAMKLYEGKDFVPVKTAATIVRDFTVLADGVPVAEVKNNFLSLVTLPLSVTAKTLSVRWQATHGAEQIHLFGIDIY